MNNEKYTELIPGTRFIGVSCGKLSSNGLAIDTNNKLWAWGTSRYGDTGVPDGTVTWPPAQIFPLDSWKYVQTEDGSTFGIKLDGTLWAWGRNNSGQLGLGTTTDVSTPVQVGVDTNWVFVETIREHTYGWKENGDLYAWGRNIGWSITMDAPVGSVDPLLAPVVTSPHFLGNYTDFSPRRPIRKISWAANGGLYITPNGILKASGTWTSMSLAYIPTAQISELPVWKLLSQSSYDSDDLVVLNNKGEAFIFGTMTPLNSGEDVPAVLGQVTGIDEEVYSVTVSDIDSSIQLKTVSGALYSIGKNNKGQAGTGNGGSEGALYTASTVSKLGYTDPGFVTDGVIWSAQTKGGNILMNLQGDVYVYGDNASGRLGIDANFTDIKSPLKVFIGEERYSQTTLAAREEFWKRFAAVNGLYNPIAGTFSYSPLLGWNWSRGLGLNVIPPYPDVGYPSNTIQRDQTVIFYSWDLVDGGVYFSGTSDTATSFRDLTTLSLFLGNNITQPLNSYCLEALPNLANLEAIKIEGASTNITEPFNLSTSFPKVDLTKLSYFRNTGISYLKVTIPHNAFTAVAHPQFWAEAKLGLTIDGAQKFSTLIWDDVRLIGTEISTNKFNLINNLTVQSQGTNTISEINSNSPMVIYLSYIASEAVTEVVPPSGVYSATAKLTSLVGTKFTGNRIVSTAESSEGVTVTEIPFELIGPIVTDTESTTPTVVTGDYEARWEIDLPFSVGFLGQSYNKVYVGNYGFITFGTLSAYDDYVPSIPDPKIIRQATEYQESIQRIYYGESGTTPNRIFKIRVEGTGGYFGVVGDSTIVTEYVFYENVPNQIDVQYGDIVTGVWGVYNDTTKKAALTGYKNSGSRISSLGAIAVEVSPIINTLKGPSGMTVLQNASVDDGFIEVTIPFAIQFLGATYSSVFIGSNSYATFGAGSDEYYEPLTLIPLPKILIGAGDASYQRVLSKVEGTAPSRTFTVRYEGNADTDGIVGSSGIEWELTFYENAPEVVDVQVGNVSDIRLNYLPPEQLTWTLNRKLYSFILTNSAGISSLKVNRGPNVVVESLQHRTSYSILIQACTNLQSIDFDPGLFDTLDSFNNFTSYTSYDILTIQNNPVLTEVKLPSVRYIVNIFVVNCPLLTTLYLPDLIVLNGTIVIDENSPISSLAFLNNLQVISGYINIPSSIALNPGFVKIARTSILARPDQAWRFTNRNQAVLCDI